MWALGAQVRMVVEHAQVGCVLGKGGEVISDLRRRTGANIRVSDKRDLPECAGSDDGLITVGYLRAVLSRSDEEVEIQVLCVRDSFPAFSLINASLYLGGLCSVTACAAVRVECL